jgi:hypothetical protein
MPMGATNYSEVAVSLPIAKDQTILGGWVSSRLFQKLLEIYLSPVIGVWNHFPGSLRPRAPGRIYGRHMHAMVRLRSDRKQYFATYFLRNRPELDLMRRIATEKAPDSTLDISVLACSKGAEVYSILWALRSARPDLKFRSTALDISQEIVEFAARGVYSLRDVDILNPPEHFGDTAFGSIIWNTWRDQGAPIFERMTDEEINAMFEMKGNDAKIRPFLKEGITWRCADAGDPKLVNELGPQDIVVANRFLCHMEPAAATKCLRNVARMVKPGGYLFVSGIDLDVRARVARELGWKPVGDLLKEIHEGDPSLSCGWPLHYWGLEPFDGNRSDWKIRYSSVFQIGEASAESTPKRLEAKNSR